MSLQIWPDHCQLSARQYSALGGGLPGRNGIRVGQAISQRIEGLMQRQQPLSSQIKRPDLIRSEFSHYLALPCDVVWAIEEWST
jgi:hypothetical protein